MINRCLYVEHIVRLAFWNVYDRILEISAIISVRFVYRINISF